MLGAYPGLSEHFKAVKLDPHDTHLRLALDFNTGGCDAYGVPDRHYPLEEVILRTLLNPEPSAWAEGTHHDQFPSLTTVHKQLTYGAHE